MAGKHIAELKDGAWLRRAYINEQKTTHEIARMLGCAISSAARALHRAGIRVRGKVEGVAAIPEKTCPHCGKVFPVGGRGKRKRTAKYCSRSCHMFNQTTRKRGSHTPRPKKNRDTLHNYMWLHQRYIEENKSTGEIATELKCSVPSVIWALNKFEIPVRDSSESKKGRPNTVDWTEKMRSDMTEKQKEAWKTRDHVSRLRGINYHSDPKICQRNATRYSRFGITAQEYTNMCDEQNGNCAICGEKETRVDSKTGLVVSLSVDHNHKTGDIRGLLCNHCNVALGHVKDDPDRLLAMVAYLLKHTKDSKWELVMPYQTKAAFRCKTCGHLESASHAGNDKVPVACSVCSSGIDFSPKGIKTRHPENWEVLSKCTEEQLANYGLKQGDVEEHVPFPVDSVNDEPKHIRVDASESMVTDDKV